MKEYEIVAKYYNACGGAAHPRTDFDEAELADPADYVRGRHGKEFDKFVKDVLPDGRLLFTFDNGSVKYTYEFTEL